jgi:hypothetical protein
MQKVQKLKFQSMIYQKQKHFEEVSEKPKLVSSKAV